MSEQQNLVAIGTIVGGFGLDGMMKVMPLTHSMERFTRGLEVWVGAGDRSPARMTIREVRTRGSVLIVGIDGIRTRTEVDSLTGSHLFVDGEHRVALPERTWFIDDIVGMTVVDEQGSTIGIISDVLTLPAQHVYVVRRQGREVLIPAVAEIVRRVDIAGRTMTVRMPDGLLDVYREDGSKNEN